MTTQFKFLFFFILTSLISCDDKRIFDQYKTINKTWHKDSVVQFELPKLEASKYYDLFITMRDNSDYKYNNIFLIVSLQQPNKQTKVDTLEFEMANPDGSLMGEGFSDIKESKLVYKLNESFKLKGQYKLKIQQAVRETGKINPEINLQGITEVGLRIENKD